MQSLRTFILAVTLLGTPAYAHVTVDARQIVTERLSLASALAMRLDLAKDIEAGLYDRSGLTIPVLNSGRIEAVPLTAAVFDRLSSVSRLAVTHQLARYAESFYWRSYTVTIDGGREDLRGEEILARLGIDPTAVRGRTKAEDLLSEYAQTWAYKDSGRRGPNCWHTSLASIFVGWSAHRYMGPDEFTCHMDNSFTELTDATPADLQFGDLIRLTSGGEVHGFTYIGTDRADSSRHIVFTKNGYARGYFLFMDLDTVHNLIYPDTDISFLRPTRTPVDPAADDTSECYDEYAGYLLPEPEADRLVLAGFKANAVAPMAPVTLLP